MIRATTPKHVFIFDQDPSLYSRILITYTQGDKIILEKEKDDLTIEENQVSFGVSEYSCWYRLTQEETKKFTASSGSPVKVQIRVLTAAGEALASEKKTVYVQDVLNDEVLV